MILASDLPTPYQKVGLSNVNSNNKNNNNKNLEHLVNVPCKFHPPVIYISIFKQFVVYRI